MKGTYEGSCTWWSGLTYRKRAGCAAGRRNADIRIEISRNPLREDWRKISLSVPVFSCALVVLRHWQSVLPGVENLHPQRPLRRIVTTSFKPLLKLKQMSGERGERALECATDPHHLSTLEMKKSDGLEDWTAFSEKNRRSTSTSHLQTLHPKLQYTVAIAVAVVEPSAAQKACFIGT